MVASDVRMAVVDEARSWMGTPVVHQGHIKGVGADCRGLVAGVCVRLGLLPPDWWECNTAPDGYSRTPTNGMLYAACRRFMREIDISEVQPADTLLLRFSLEPQHLAIAAPYAHGGLSMIHAYSRARPARVIEHRLSDVWRARIVAAFVLPGVD